MALSVPKEVLERALRNSPPSFRPLSVAPAPGDDLNTSDIINRAIANAPTQDAPNPVFSTYASTMSRIQGVSTPTVAIPEPIPVATTVYNIEGYVLSAFETFSIGPRQFLGNLNVRRVVGGTSTKNIFFECFYNCTNLEEATFPEVGGLGNSVFENCLNLETVSFPALELAPDRGFGNCRKIKSINSSNFPVLRIINTLCFGSCFELKTVDLPNVTTIRNSGFYYCYNITNVSIPSAVTIEASVFATCFSLPAISLPRVTSLGQSAFFECAALTDVKLNLPRSGIQSTTFSRSGLTAIHVRPAPNTPAGWTIGPNQTIGGAAGVTVIDDWTEWPN